MTVNDYISHHGLKKVSGGALPPTLAHKFDLAEDVEYHSDPPSLTRWVGICRARNYAAVFRSENGSLTNVTDLKADLPDLNKST